MRTALYTTFYPAAAPYLRHWYDSVAAQTDRDFDLWIGLDNLSPEEAEAYIGRTVPATWIPNDRSGSPAHMRNKAIDLLTREYDEIILSDADDVFQDSRVAAARRDLATNDLAACALRIMDEQGCDLGRVFTTDAMGSFDDLLPRHNIFGLSNSAYRAEILSCCLPIPSDCVLIDWLLATRAWSLGARLSFDLVPRMFYRQYSANTAGVLTPFSESQVLVSSCRVLKHYSLLLESSWRLPEHCRTAIDKAAVRVREFHDVVSSSSHRLAQYVDALNRLKPKYVWWWCVANPELETLWKN